MKKTKSKNWESVHDEASTWARWIALYEAINYLGDKAEEKGVKFEKLDLKPLKILEYIESTQDIILRKLLKQEYNIDVCYSDIENDLDSIEQKKYQYSP
jgi:hypothetical protein